MSSGLADSTNRAGQELVLVGTDTRDPSAENSQESESDGSPIRNQATPGNQVELELRLPDLPHERVCGSSAEASSQQPTQNLENFDEWNLIFVDGIRPRTGDEEGWCFLSPNPWPFVSAFMLFVSAFLSGSDVAVVAATSGVHYECLNNATCYFYTFDELPKYAIVSGVVQFLCIFVALILLTFSRKHPIRHPISSLAPETILFKGIRETVVHFFFAFWALAYMFEIFDVILVFFAPYRKQTSLILYVIAVLFWGIRNLIEIVYIAVLNRIDWSCQNVSRPNWLFKLTVWLLGSSLLFDALYNVAIAVVLFFIGPDDPASLKRYLSILISVVLTILYKIGLSTHLLSKYRDPRRDHFSKTVLTVTPRVTSSLSYEAFAEIDLLSCGIHTNQDSGLSDAIFQHWEPYFRSNSQCHCCGRCR